jgi:hypothetical protein
MRAENGISRPCELGWVTAAIPPFLVVADGGSEPVETGHALDDSAADLRVQPQDVPLLRAQRAWLQQNPLAYPKLADFAEQRRKHQLLSFPSPQAEAPPYGLDIARDLT